MISLIDEFDGYIKELARRNRLAREEKAKAQLKQKRLMAEGTRRALSAAEARR